MGSIHHLKGEEFIFNGRTFEEYMLGRDEPDLRHIASFNEALFASIFTQPDGFPDLPNAGIKDFLLSVRGFFGTIESNYVKVFSTIRKPFDWHGVDCFFFYRGTAVFIDITRNERKKCCRPKKSHLFLSDDIIGCNKRIDEFSEQVADMLVDPMHYRLPLRTTIYINKNYCGYC